MTYGTVNADLMTTSDGVSSAGLYGFKNRIINGAMVIDQRNAGASVTLSTSTSYPVDRLGAIEDTDGVMTAQQDTSAPTGFINSVKFTTTTADASLGSTQYARCQQRIEGLNVADLAWGTASAATVTLSFWVRSSLTGTFGGAITNADFNRSYPFTYTISSANTWEQKSVTIAGDTSGTWLTTNGIGMQVVWGLGVGSTYSGTAGAWAGAGYLSATGATSVIGTLNATFYITGVQLEKGSTATSFDYRPYTTELQLCQRYFAKTFPQTVAPASNLGNYYSAICATAATSSAFGFTAVWKLPVEMRSSATLTTYNPYAAGSGFTASGAGNYAVSVIVTDTGSIALRSSDALTAGSFLAVNATASAEL